MFFHARLWLVSLSVAFLCLMSLFSTHTLVESLNEFNSHISTINNQQHKSHKYIAVTIGLIVIPLIVGIPILTTTSDPSQLFFWIVETVCLGLPILGWQDDVCQCGLLELLHILHIIAPNGGINSLTYVVDYDRKRVCGHGSVDNRRFVWWGSRSGSHGLSGLLLLYLIPFWHYYSNRPLFFIPVPC